MTEPSAQSRLQTAVRHFQVAALTALLAGGVDGALSARGLKLSLTNGLLLGAGLVVVVGALFGLLQGLLVYEAGRLLTRFGLSSRIAASLSSDRQAEREPVVRLHAFLGLLTVLTALGVVALKLLVAGLTSIKDPELANSMMLLGVTLLGVGLVLSGSLLRGLMLRAMGAFDRRIGLPFPRWGWLRYLLFVLLPLGYGIVPLFQEHGVQLGILSVPFGAILFVAVQGFFLRLWDARPKRISGPRLSSALGWATRALVLGGVIAGVLVSSRWKGATAVTAEGHLLPVAAGAVRTLTDVDRDGISSLYGGKDCAPFDGRRSPSAKDIPGNGIDEDCNGTDASESALLELKTFSERAPRDGKKQLNVVWLVVDSLRADHLGLYGYNKETSPHIDEIGKDSWVFTRAYSQASTTRLSMPSMLSGRLPDTMEWKKGPDPAPSVAMLPTLLKQEGYSTSLVINQYVKKGLTGLQKPFQHVMATPKGADWHSGDHAIGLAIAEIERAQSENKPFFITVHFDDVHHPYKAHKGRSVPNFNGATKDLGSYDRCIASLDNLLRVLTAHLKNKELWDETVLIITADHGEEFEEHGNTIHSLACYVESVHVPLIVRIPGVAPAQSEDRVALVDIVPTLVEALQLPKNKLELDGQSLFVPVLAREHVQPERPIFCSIFQLMRGRTNFFTRAVSTEKYTLVHEALSDKTELFNDVEDPGQTNDIASGNPQVVEELTATLKAGLRGNLWEIRSFQ